MAIRFCLLEKYDSCCNKKWEKKDSSVVNGHCERDIISSNAMEFDSSIFYNASKFFDLNRSVDYIPVVDKDYNFICFCYKDVENEKLREIVMELCTFDNILNFNEFCSANSKIVLWGTNENAYLFHSFLNKQNIEHYNVGELWKYICDDYYLDFEKNEENINIFFEGNYALPVKDSAYGRTVLERFDDDHQPILNFYKKCCEYKEVLKSCETRHAIANAIKSDNPFFMGRIGNTELSILKEYFEMKQGILSHYSPFWLDYLYDCCGFFGNEKGTICNDDVDRYAELTLNAIKNCDINICWGDDDLASGLSFLLDKYEKEGSIRVNWDDLDNPSCCFDDVEGVNALLGKKILVISPFVDTIKRQFKVKPEIYKDDKAFPDCELILYKAPETQMGNYDNYSSWFEVFEKVLLDVRNIEFDIALIGAGAYGFPLASEIKNIGKQAISLSSYLANWFGIKMKRYCAYTPINKNWNEWWCFPYETPPEGYERIEDGCYWR